MAGCLSTLAAAQSLSDKKNIHVVVLGFPTAERNKYKPESLHDQRAKIVVDFFKDISDCEIQTPGFSKVQEFRQYLVDTFKSLGDDDVLIIWFGGATRDEDEEWHVKLENGPRNGWIDGQTLLQQCYDSGCNIAMFLDCNIPTRFKDKCAARSDGRGNTEIMARGSIAQTAQGKSIEGHSSDFLTNVIESINEWVQAIKTGKYKGTKPRSIAQIMGTNRLLRYHPTRIWDREPCEYGREHGVRIDRLTIWPRDVRMTGKVCFRHKRVQGGEFDAGTETGGADAANAEDIPEDEGYDEGLEESIEGPVNDPSNGEIAMGGNSLFCTPAPE